MSSSESASEWSAADREQFAPLEQHWTDRAKFTLTVPKLITEWERFVTNVEQGYRLGIDDYRNALDTRKLLQEAADAVDADLSQRLRVAIRRDDLRFEVVTVASDPVVWEGGWWAVRIPRVLVGDLADDVRRNNLRPITD